MLVGDLTAMPAMARIAESSRRCRPGSGPRSPTTCPATSPTPADVTWLEAPSGTSRLAEVVEAIDWPAGDGYFWMAGESAQMRAIRKYLMRERKLPARRTT